MAANGHALPAWGVALSRTGAAAAALAWAFLLCDRLYRRLGKAPRSADVRRAALIAGTTVTILLVGGLLLLRHVFADPVYGLIVAMPGLMLWVSAAIRITLSLALWSATPARDR
ncbi:hypothetical protein [Actinomadura macrotermitis]|uniref:Uncharacterized protein n=1 Tax=Actinomadura macrotermitis TaxID=2585200 RepID=A0A7K0BSD8_9ACTN|nr:hypothetical protein [Actinomadura macrotermitis]MQY04089.1 hypothetical protein [Actinomadura macrotermitis]